MVDMGLSDRDKAILRFEEERLNDIGSKHDAIRNTFGISHQRYYQLVNALIDTQAAEAYRPLVVHRLRRLRAERAETRKALAGTL